MSFRTIFAAHCVSVLLLVSTAASGQADVPSPQTSELIVLLREDVARSSASPEEVVALLAHGRPEGDALLERLGSPVFARFLIEDQRLSPEDRLRRDPRDAEARLHRYVVLTYGDVSSATIALHRLLRDAMVEGAVPNLVHEFSIAPQDPEFGSGPSVIDYQWGYHPFAVGGTPVGMGMQAAWDVTRGSAWVGIVDNGIQQNHPDLGQIFKPQFAWNVISNSAYVDESYGLPPAPAAVFRGHGTHVAGIIGATSGFPGVAAGYPGFPAVGVAGSCWFCTGMIVKAAAAHIDTTDCDGDGNTNEAVQCPFESDLAAGLYWAARRGAQVINLSSGTRVGPQWVNHFKCATTPALPFCDAIAYADHLDVVMVAASGNYDTDRVQWPAADARMLTVGAVQFDAAFSSNRWKEENLVGVGSDHGPEMISHGLVAPGRDIVSTVYTGFNWSASESVRCGDATMFGAATGSDAPAGYGSCTGTSMAAPFVTGIVALMRSVNPLLSDTSIKATLRNSGHLGVAAATSQLGAGVPDASVAVQSVLASTNRLTPLFSLSNELLQDSFYTVTPQQARAAHMSNLLPLIPGNPVQGYYSYSFYGTLVKPAGVTYTIGTLPPNSVTTTRAESWVFSTHVNPKQPATELKPLYRLSFRCGDPVPSGRVTTCASQPHHSGHFYTTDINEMLAFTNQHGYRADGIEGYVYPPTGPQYPGTSALIRGKNPAQDRYALFPASKQATMVNAGFDQGLVVLGYVYEAPSTGARPNL